LYGPRSWGCPNSRM